MLRLTLATMGASLALALTVFAAAVNAGGGAQVVGQTPDEAAATSLAAALRIFDGTDDPACHAGMGDQVCVRPSSTPEQAARGIATFGVSGSGPGGAGGFFGVLGRDPAGAWQFWYGTQNVSYQLLTLPGEMIVCAAGGLNVRAGPSVEASVVGTLPDLTRVSAEQFTLTQPGTMPTESSDQVIGDGWYRLGGPIEGWASSHYLTNAEVDATTEMPPCSILNLFADR
ncbi:MAG: SH3 domain-containing protein [Dehalococcoidia bacterium]